MSKDPQYFSYAANRSKISWSQAVQALRQGHQLERAQIKDMFIKQEGKTLLNRAALIPELGIGVKAVSVFADNQRLHNLPTVQGMMIVYDPDNGAVRGMIDARLITEIKTAADSVLGAQLLAPSEPKQLLIVGAGTVAKSLISAYSACFKSLESIRVWARRIDAASQLCAQMKSETSQLDLQATTDLPSALAQADIISAATLARSPILLGKDIQRGCHLDLIGAFQDDMREADDALLRKSSLYVDARETTMEHIGELLIPLQQGVISEKDIRADLYDLLALPPLGRSSADEITLFKNGGGAHLDLMIADMILKLCG